MHVLVTWREIITYEQILDVDSTDDDSIEGKIGAAGQADMFVTCRREVLDAVEVTA